MSEYEKDVAIDPDLLEEEWLMQPALYLKYSELKRQAIEDQRDTKAKLELWQAQKSLNIRSDPSEYGLVKATNDSVNETILCLMADKNSGEDGFKRQAEYNEATYRLDVFSNVLRALDHKKKALEMLVQLHVSNWFSGPKEPKEIPPGKRIANEKAEKTDKKLRSAGRRPRR